MRVADKTGPPTMARWARSVQKQTFKQHPRHFCIAPMLALDHLCLPLNKALKSSLLMDGGWWFIDVGASTAFTPPQQFVYVKTRSAGSFVTSGFYNSSSPRSPPTIHWWAGDRTCWTHPRLTHCSTMSTISWLEAMMHRCVCSYLQLLNSTVAVSNLESAPLAWMWSWRSCFLGSYQAG